MAKVGPVRLSHGTETEQIRPTFTPWRVLYLVLVGPVVFIATGLLVHAGGNAWMLPGDAAPGWAPQGDHSVVRCVGDCR